MLEAFSEGGGTALKPALCVGASVRWLGYDSGSGLPRNAPFPRRLLEIELSLKEVASTKYLCVSVQQNVKHIVTTNKQIEQTKTNHAFLASLASHADLASKRGHA